VVGIGLLALLAYWEIWVCEGAHLGDRFVVWLYNVSAGRYDRIKEFDPDWERRYLGEPVAAVLGSLPDARLLDVGAGTGRLARALAGTPADPFLVNTDASRAMIGEAVKLVDRRASPWVRGRAAGLPFAPASFDLVCSLEMLEFTPSPRVSLEEMRRVLRPGGWLLVTNRVGRQAAWIVGRTFRRDRFEVLLDGLGLEEVETFPWQVEYDLIWARKPEPVNAPVRS
jgi:ubiquinone/menaquinone biosynthesis C-methylase UbiE